MCSGFGWDCYKKAQTRFVGLVKYLRLTAEPGAYCLLQPYSDVVSIILCSARIRRRCLAFCSPAGGG